ncbi:MAG: hypothetical protein MUC36_06690 [Planctomycetes bacterium]|jgi:hypothetical protein|nr:hypothetical protein [Planctomycetota bacterium]
MNSPLSRFAPFVLLLTSVAAQTNLINFQNPGLVAMSNTAGQPVPAAARLSTQFLNTLGVRFSSNSAFVAVVNHGTFTPSAPNLIGGTTATGALNYMQPITVQFFDPSDPTQPATTDWFRVRGDLSPLNTGTGTVRAFAVDGTLLGTQTLPDTAPGMVFTMAFAAPGIHRVLITGTTGTVGWDDVEFLPVRRAASYLPYGAGCAGTLGVPVLSAAPGGLPLPGNIFTAVLSGIGSGVALMATGVTEPTLAPLPVPLGAIGMPGCELWVDAVQFDAMIAIGNQGNWTWLLPSGSAMLGQRFFQQGFVFDPAANAFGFVASNAAAATIGS